MKKDDKSPQLAPYRWKKGQSGNPAGKPHGVRNFSTLVEIALTEVGKKLKGKNKAQVDAEVEILTKMLALALSGNTEMIKVFLDRRFGRVTQAIELGGPGGKPLSHELSPETQQAVGKLLDSWNKPNNKKKDANNKSKPSAKGKV